MLSILRPGRRWGNQRIGSVMMSIIGAINKAVGK